MSVEFFETEVTRNEEEEVSLWEVAADLGFQAWRIRVYRFPHELPEARAFVVTDRDAKYMTIFVEKNAEDIRALVKHEIAECLPEELALDLSNKEAHRLAEYLERTLP